VIDDVRSSSGGFPPKAPIENILKK
jgi:hypothetical protein